MEEIIKMIEACPRLNDMQKSEAIKDLSAMQSDGAYRQRVYFSNSFLNDHSALKLSPYTRLTRLFVWNNSRLGKDFWVQLTAAL